MQTKLALKMEIGLIVIYLVFFSVKMDELQVYTLITIIQVCKGETVNSST